MLLVGSASLRTSPTLTERRLGSSAAPQMTPLLHSLITPPNTASPPDPANIISTHLASLLFSHLLRSSPRAKAAARRVIPIHVPSAPQSAAGNFFVPADGAPPQDVLDVEPDDEPPQSLLHILSENLSLSLLARSRVNASDIETREWDRLAAGYLCLLVQWLWEDSKAVRDFLDAGGLGVVSRLPNMHR